MEFDKSMVYTALNADELKPGSKVIVADDLAHLKCFVKDEVIRTLESVLDEASGFRFVTNGGKFYLFAYLVEPPEEKVLKWTDLKLFDVIKRKHADDKAVVIRLSNVHDGTSTHVNAGGEWLMDDELEDWEKVSAEEVKE